MSKISVIVPVYNVESYVRKCVDSIRAQTYTELEIILVDDGATDASPRICDELAAEDSRIRVIHKTNGGLSSARNAGLDVATGDYIGFIDSDDYISADMYERLAAAIEPLGERGLSNVMFCRVTEDGVTSPSSVIHTSDAAIEPQAYLEELLLHQGDVSVCTKLFPRALIEHTRFIEGRYNEDLLFMLELIPRIEQIRFVGSVGYYYLSRRSSASSTYGNAVRDMVTNSVLVYDTVTKQYPSLSAQALRFMMYQHMAFLLLVPDSECHTALYHNARSQLKRYYSRAMRNSILTAKQKVIISALAIAPRATAHRYQKRHAS